MRWIAAAVTCKPPPNSWAGAEARCTAAWKNTARNAEQVTEYKPLGARHAGDCDAPAKNVYEAACARDNARDINPKNSLMKRPSFESRLTLLALAGGLPALLVAGALLLASDLPPGLSFLIMVALVTAWLGFSLSLKGRLSYQLNTLSNILEALREEDYSMRSRRSRDRGAFGDVFREVNALSSTLREQRVKAREATALLRKVLAEIDIAVFAFDGKGRLMLVNRAGERLVHADEAAQKTAIALGLDDLLIQEGRQTVARRFPGGSGRWDVWAGSFREAGVQHWLHVISDLSRALREEERKAWQRLVRVIGHELNNSLTPIKSMVATLRTRLDDGAAVA